VEIQPISHDDQMSGPSPRVVGAARRTPSARDAASITEFSFATRLIHADSHHTEKDNLWKT
jgi:hypothetical protein